MQNGLRRLAPGALTLISTLATVVLIYGTSSAGELSIIGVASAQSANPTPFPNCSPNVVPVGQANPPGSQTEPLAPIWCFNLVPQGPATRVTGNNDWLDTFQGDTQMGQFNDGDLGYRVFDSIQNGGTSHTKHFTNNNHWMDDNAGGFLGGTMLRPNRSFTFENGKLVVEADFAAGITGYLDSGGGDVAWGEIDISTGSTPMNNGTTDGLYAYGRFPGYDTFGCRIHAGQKFTCSYEAARGGANGQDTYPCFEFSPDRLVEISGFEQCGPTHFGGDPGFGAPGQYFRTCNSAAEEPDMMCRDRFRLELSQNGLTAYVNGALYFQDTGWPARNQLTSAMVSGQPVYVYFSDWEDTPNQPAYRFHWQRLAVNPHNPDGSIVAPSASPSFCLGQPMNTCPTASTSGSSATPTPTSTTTPTPRGAATSTLTSTATTTPQARATSTNTPTSTPTSTRTPGQTATPTSATTVTPSPQVVGNPGPLLVGSNLIQPNLDSNRSGVAEAFSYTSAAAGTVSHLNVYLDPTNAASKLVVGLYSNRGGHPGQLLTGGIMSSLRAGAWNSVSVPPVQLRSNSRYWIAVLSPAGSGTLRFRDAFSGSGRDEISAQNNLSVLPTQWSTGQVYTNSPASAYAAP